MNNQHAGLSRVLAEQYVTQLRQRASGPVARSEATMSKLTRALIVGATLVAMNLAGLAAIAQPNGEGSITQPRVTENWNYYNQSTRVPPAQLKARMQADATQREQSDRLAYYNQATRMSPAELKAWTGANDGADTPTAPTAPVAPARPAEPNGQPGWLVVSLGILAAAMAAVAGLAVLVARRAVRTARLGQAV